MKISDSWVLFIVIGMRYSSGLLTGSLLIQAQRFERSKCVWSLLSTRPFSFPVSEGQIQRTTTGKWHSMSRLLGKIDCRGLWSVNRLPVEVSVSPDGHQH